MKSHAFQDDSGIRVGEGSRYRLQPGEESLTDILLGIRMSWPDSFSN